MKLGSLNRDSQQETAMERTTGWIGSRENRLNELIARLAVRFVGVDRHDVDRAVDVALASLGKVLGARGGAVMLLDQKRSTIAHGYEWRARSAGVPDTSRRGTRIDCLQWFRERLLRGERIEIRGPDDLPAEAAAERAALDRRGIRSVLMVPITLAGRPAGFLAFAGSNPSRWSADEVAAVELAADLFGRLFERCEIEDVRFARMLELERIGAELEEFAYHAAHDLKAPLTAIAGYLDLLRRDCGEQLDVEACELIDQADRSAEKLNGLIDTLLIYSSLGFDPLRVGVTDCQALLEGICEEIEPVMRDRDANIVADALPRVAADTAQLRRVFQNLLVNAIKFGGSAPRVTLGVEETEDDYVFTVTDEGPGIDPADHERIFEPFVRLASNDPQPGSGVGLAICKKIIEQHGGRIWVESSLGTGASFRFLLPKRAAGAC
jgi:signal transduction histidine kinase